MPRQPRSASSAQPEPSNGVNGSTRVKMEKVKQEQARRAREADEEEADGDAGADADADASGEEEEEEGSGSPKGRKRARVNDDGDSRPSQSQTNGAIPRSTTLPRDPTDGFIPGSITRIQLRNFVTYDYVEFSPGPYLNMIIGPNGTGKSSIACAIALGLNFSPKVLGRADHVRSYVKNGTNDGHIEIELKSPRGKPNLVIHRKLSASTNTSAFMLNGKNATGKEVSLRMAELGVQVGNLCSFLPQDKVSEFAMMSSQDLLVETQKAAGDTNLTSWHETLMENGKEMKGMKEKILSDQSQLTQMHARNAAIERDVERYHERRAIEAKIAMLEVCIPYATYHEIKVRFHQLKELQRKMHQKVTKLKAKNEPAHKLLITLKASLKTHDQTREARKRDTQKYFNEMQKMYISNEEMENLAENLQSKLDHLVRAEQDRLKAIRDLESRVRKMEEDCAAPLDEPHRLVLEDLAKGKDSEIKKKIQHLTRERNEISNKRDDFESDVSQKMEERAVLLKKVENAEKQLGQLDSLDHQKLARLYELNKDAADAVAWLRRDENKRRFRMDIIEPALITLTVPDKRYAPAVENMVGHERLKTFVAQCREDYDLLNELVNDQGAIGRKAWIATWFRAPSTQIPNRPMNEEELRGLNFDGYLSEYVVCPPAMMFFLQHDMMIHRIAIALKPSSVNIPNATAAVARSGGATFIVGSVVNQVTRSRYGRKAVSNLTREIRKDIKWLAAPTADGNLKRQYQDQITQHKLEISGYDDGIAKMKVEGKEIEDESKEIEQKIKETRTRIDGAKDAQTDKAKLRQTLSREKNKLQQKRSAPSVDEERTDIQTQLTNNAKKRAKIVKDYVALAQRAVKEGVEATRVGLEYLQVNANKVALEELCNKKDEKFNKALEEFEKVHAEYDDIKKLSKQTVNDVRDAIDNATEEIREQFREVQEKREAYDKANAAAQANGTDPPSAEGVDLRTADECRAELEAQEAQLELVSKTQPGVIEQYEKRKRDIEVLERTLEEKQRDAAKVERSIKLTLDRWKPALEELVGSIGQKFSAAFDRIGCAGEIHIRENEDYDKWAIDILVKFRDDEKLQLLTGQRQSGGERSLTTILYLMSLTEEARAPFSLVDEINQGMDQRAERVVHNSMVDVTCKDDAAQYFLITPKLLPDLKYHERMKILCVNNGEWLPEETRVGNLMNLIEGYVGRHSRAIAGH